MIGKVGILTIGQTPRLDLVPEIRRLMPGNIEIVEKGALDGCTLDEVREFRPKDDADAVVTPMRDGTVVMIGKTHLRSRLEKKIEELNTEGVDVIGLVCGAEWAPFRSRKPLVMPYPLLLGVLSSITIEGKLGTIVPTERQIEPSGMAPFRGLAAGTIGVAASPYGDLDGIRGAARKLKDKVELTVLFAFGYNLRAKEEVGRITQRPVILIRSLLARALAELIDNPDGSVQPEVLLRPGSRTE